MPSYATERHDPLGESQLETLLRELLDKEGSERPRPDIEAPREIAELRDAARRLRAASHWMPLPEGRFAVRRALLATAEQSRNLAGPGRAPWRRASLWLSMAAVAALVLGAFGLGAGALNVLVPPSSPVYGLRLMLDQARGTFVPGHPNPGQYALGYQFPAVQIPAVGGVTRTADGKVGGLPATLALTPTEACATGAPCGRFVVSLAGLSTPASAKFGELKGTFACGPDGCTLKLVKATGVFARVSTLRVSVSGARVSEGRLTAKMASRGEWVAEVAMAAESLEADGMLPAGVTVSDLVNDADTNERDIRHGGGPNGSVTTVTPNIASPGAKTSGTAGGGDSLASGPHGTSNAGNTRSGTTDGSGANRSGGSGAPGSGGVSVDASGAGGIAGPNGHGGGLSVNGGGSAGGDGVNVGSGATVNDNAPTGNGGVSVGGGANVNSGGGSSAGGGVNVNAGSSAGTGGVNVNAGGSSSAGGGANVNAGGSSSAGGGANVNAGGSSAGGGVNVNAGTGGINVNGGGVNVSGGTGGGGSGGGGSSGSGNGSH